MFFASSDSAWQRLFQTHPPLEERIRRIDPALAGPSPTIDTEELVGEPTPIATLSA
jgi:hypothetical protein